MTRPLSVGARPAIAPPTAQNGVVVNPQLQRRPYRGTQAIVGMPRCEPSQPLAGPALGGYGANVLLVVPTNNPHKVSLLQRLARRVLAKTAPRTLLVLRRPAASGVNEQPYNDAGARGAQNRAQAVATHLSSAAGNRFLQKHNVGTVLIGAVENYDELRDAKVHGAGPQDIGCIALYNATEQRGTMAWSRGVQLPKGMVREAMRYGYRPGDSYGPAQPDYPAWPFTHQGGNMTVGKVLAAHVPGLADDDPHRTLCGVSRYLLLEEAAALLARYESPQG